ncbi:hypothetical protein HDC92_001661 [Pedobacter sp. AK017]|uniref:heparinase II/III family protein n=1 Tax=Pedobacter sp. AK017 TaxID=2723073 RepID=UPI0016202A59|nr:heparinase II/III family protein [Pedobacter sp. AK017]MBB5437987.1 hypothetical protein [Pedobacter sp. AK017]
MKLFRNILFFIVLIGGSIAKGQNLAVYDNSKPVVLLQPLDMLRVKQIEAMLPEKPSGFGETYKNRKEWNRLLNSRKYDKLLKSADSSLTEPFPAWSDTDYLAYWTKGTSVPGKNMLQKRLLWLTRYVFAECLTDQGKYTKAAEDAILELCRQKSWVNPTHDYNKVNFEGKKYLVELSAVSYAHHIAQALYLLGDKIGPKVKDEAIKALRLRVFDPVLNSVATGNSENFFLTNTNNFNAVCLSGTVGAAETILNDKTERAKFIAIAERYHKNGVHGFLPDGYCTEGLGYYNYGFGHFVLLRETVYRNTGGQIDLFADPKVKLIAEFLPKTVIIHGVFPSIGDCRPYTQPSAFILYYVNRNLGVDVSDFKKTAFEGRSTELAESILAVFPEKISSAQVTVKSKSNELRSYFDQAGVLTVRPGKNSAMDMGVAIKGGNNNEHHNHNDIGSFSIVVGDEVLMGDPGIIPYTSKTFGPERYTYKTIASYGHPVPLIAGKEQIPGAAAKANVISTSFNNDQDKLLMDIASAYPVKELKKLEREFTYNRKPNGFLTVKDNFSFSNTQTYETALITRGKWKQVGPGAIEITGKKDKLLVTIESQDGFEIKSEELSEGGLPYTRLAIRLNKPVQEGTISMVFKPIR